MSIPRTYARHVEFIALLGPSKAVRYSDGGPKLLSRRGKAERRAVRKRQRQARKRRRR